MFDENARYVPLMMDRGQTAIRCQCWINESDGDPFGCVIDTGARYTVIPQRIWNDVLDKAYVESLPLVSHVSGVCSAKLKVRAGTVSLKLLGDADPKMLRGHGSDEYLSKVSVSIPYCHVWLLYDQDAVAQDRKLRPVKNHDEEKDRPQELTHILLGFGGGSLGKGGLCVNWVKREAHYVEIRSASESQPLNQA